jgi:hypothetical protein
MLSQMADAWFWLADLQDKATDSMGFDVRRCFQCSAGKSYKASSRSAQQLPCRLLFALLPPCARFPNS